jgi:glycerophosphoryl diester phosphodiesterase
MSFDVQGHRGARGLKPENTLPSFEAAIDVGVTTVETDLHLTRDGVPILSHDPFVTPRLCRLLPEADGPEPASQPLIRTLTLDQLRNYAADGNPDRHCFPSQDATVTPLAQMFGDQHRVHPYTLPALADLLAFVQAYAGDLGRAAGKTPAQQECARRLRFDLELKRVPFHPEVIGDAFDGCQPGLLEQRVVEVVQTAGVVERIIIRSFDHRCVRAVRLLEPRVTTAVLVDRIAPVSPVSLVREAEAQIYCPAYQFLDEAQVGQAHAEGIAVVPWTPNRTDEWDQLLAWRVDGITTDFPDRLMAHLADRDRGSRRRNSEK